MQTSEALLLGGLSDMHERKEPLTELLQQAARGERAALDRIFALLYPDLRRIAHARLRGQDGAAHLETTALVHESFLRFVEASELMLADRKHFFAYAAKTMRNIIIDSAREQLAQRRGGGRAPVRLDTALAGSLPAAEGEASLVAWAARSLLRIGARAGCVAAMRCSQSARLAASHSSALSNSFDTAAQVEGVISIVPRSSLSLIRKGGVKAVIEHSCLQRRQQESAGLLPLTPHGALGLLRELGDLRLGVTGEIAHLHDLGQRRIKRFERPQGIVNGDQ